MIILDINQTGGNHTDEYIETTVREMLNTEVNFIITKYGGYYVCDGITVEIAEDSITNNGFIMGETGLVIMGFKNTLLISKKSISELLQLNLEKLLTSYKPNEE